MVLWQSEGIRWEPTDLTRQGRPAPKVVGKGSLILNLPRLENCPIKTCEGDLYLYSCGPSHSLIHQAPMYLELKGAKKGSKEFRVRLMGAPYESTERNPKKTMKGEPARGSKHKSN